MPITYDAAVKTDRITATRDYFANGSLEILNGSTVLVSFGLSSAGGSVSGDTWTLAFDNSTVAAIASGTANLAQIKDNTGNPHITGLSVGTGGTDLILDNTSISAGQNVTLSSATIQHA